MGLNDFFTGIIPSIKQKSVSTPIMELITNILLLGKLKPSDKIPTETEFAQKMRVGRSSFRETIKMLTSLGVVEIRRGEVVFIVKRYLLQL